MWALGSSVNQLLDQLGSLPLPDEGVRVLDLGCGKGAVSVQAASKFGFHVVGVDVTHEFLEDAKKKAAQYGVSAQCTFLEQDIHRYVMDVHAFDVVILASLGGIFGSHRGTMNTLRTQVVSGGYIVLDDGFLKQSGSLRLKGYGHYRSYGETVEELTAYGDTVVSEISTTEASRQINEEYLKDIERRSAELMDRYPELEDALRKHVDLQREEVAVLDSEVEGMLWVIQRAAT
jgi:cyclopropane fatty-acyl-phospholipid synthase-like methyltransferase